MCVTLRDRAAAVGAGTLPRAELRRAAEDGTPRGEVGGARAGACRGAPVRLRRRPRQPRAPGVPARLQGLAGRMPPWAQLLLEGSSPGEGAAGEGAAGEGLLERGPPGNGASWRRVLLEMGPGPVDLSLHWFVPCGWQVDQHGRLARTGLWCPENSCPFPCESRNISKLSGHPLVPSPGRHLQGRVPCSLPTRVHFSSHCL